jgi:cystathionine beta-lyase/cystathionine gamma-synthase
MAGPIPLDSMRSQRYLNDKLAALEGAQAAVATASGMAAVTTTLLTVRAGDHLLAGGCLVAVECRTSLPG